MATILVVEDDKNTQLLTAARLKPYYTVVCANNGEEALDILYAQSIDLIVSDIMMPKMDGYEMLKTLREQKYETPILLLTAKQGIEDKREGYALGSDDYLTKPVVYEELLWKINAQLKRGKIATEKKIVVGKTIVDENNYSVVCNGSGIELTKKEFELLFKLLSYPGRVFTRNQLLDEIWGYDNYSGEDTVKVHINRLRTKFDESCKDFEIITVRGLGYKAELKGESK